MSGGVAVSWVAASATGAAVYLAVGAAMGRLPALRLPRSQRPDRAALLRQAGLDVSWAQFVAASVFLAAATGTLIVAVTGTPAVAIVPAVGAGFAPHALLARRRATRVRDLQEAWPDAIRDLLASTSAGLSLHQALVGLTTRGPTPIREAFVRYPVLSRVAGVVAALELIREELADPTSDRVLEVLALAHERGSHILGEILHDLAEDTSRDVRTLEEMQTDALEQRINAAAVFVLPWLVLLVLTAREGHFRDFYRSGGGLLVVVLGAALSLFGMWVVNRLAREPTEPRVLGGGVR